MPHCTKRIKIISFVLVFTILITVGLATLGLEVYSWVVIQQANSTSTTTFIGSNDVVQLGCWPENAVQSVQMNTTKSTTKVYSSDQLLSNEALEGKKLYQIGSEKLSESMRFQVRYHPDDYEPLRTEKNGYIAYNFSLKATNETLDNCTLELFMFDSYFEFKKFFTEEKFKYFNRTCFTTTKKTGDVHFVVNFTLPAHKYTYIAGAFPGTIKFVAYSVIDGFITNYNTSILNLEQCSNSDDVDQCLVSIGGRFGAFDSQEICIFVEAQVLNKYDDRYIFIKIEVSEGYTPATVFMIITIVICSIPMLMLFICGSAVSYEKYKNWKRIHMATPVQATPGGEQPNVATSSIQISDSDQGNTSEEYTNLEVISRDAEQPGTQPSDVSDGAAKLHSDDDETNPLITQDQHQGGGYGTGSMSKPKGDLVAPGVSGKSPPEGVSRTTKIYTSDHQATEDIRPDY